ncbi:MAG: (d)CMP kinase [Armatimonadota bacterium]
MSDSTIITIDGPAGAGKSTIARLLATQLNYQFLDTGAIYRCVALKALSSQTDLSDEAAVAQAALSAVIRFAPGEGLQHVTLDGDDVTSVIRQPEVSQAASIVSALPSVRAALLQMQRDIGNRGCTVVEGRDTGTVVFPNAGVKIFLDASPEERARRRHMELQGRGTEHSLEQIAQEMRERDSRDSQREVAPLAAAPDAVTVMTDGLSIEQVVEQIKAIWSSRNEVAAE